MGRDERQDPATGDLVIALARRVRRAHVEALADWEVTPGQARALRVLTGADAMRPSELADALRIAPRSATEVVDALEQRGWVRREPDPTDRRATRLVPTDDGRQLVERIDDVRREASQRVLDVLTPAQRRTLHQILAVVVGEDL
ncbi:MarR family winged helix-turn-helix transcriptional regulator [Nocardioides sp. GCM10028917]|uniref:MarR family winged helix-turn-helix transcriptional regulator n=1 Tax=Nocardioides sp. GCM10028917 TaxID=3273408 RepID=UPI003620F229